MDPLLNAFRSAKTFFWEEHKAFSESEIQNLWNQQVAYLSREVGANPVGNGQSPLPQKRAVPSKDAVGEPRPSKRRDLVGIFLQAS